MSIRFIPSSQVGRASATSFKNARLGLTAQLASKNLGVLDPDLVDVVLKRTVTAMTTAWFVRARLAEAHVVSTAEALQRLIDTEKASCAMIVAYNSAAVGLYKNHGDAWRAFRMLLKTDDLRPPKPPPLFGQSVVTGAEPFVLSVNVPCAVGPNGLPTGQIKRFDLPAQVAFRPNEAFSDAFRAKSGSEMKAAAMSQAIDGQLGGNLGADPRAVAVAISLERAVAAVLLIITAYIVFKALHDWLTGAESLRIQGKYAETQADCALKQIKAYEACLTAGQPDCAAVANGIDCPADLVPPRGLIDQASGLVLTVGMVVGGFFLIKMLRDRQQHG